MQVNQGHQKQAEGQMFLRHVATSCCYIKSFPSCLDTSNWSYCDRSAFGGRRGYNNDCCSSTLMPFFPSKQPDNGDSDSCNTAAGLG